MNTFKPNRYTDYAIDQPVLHPVARWHATAPVATSAMVCIFYLKIKVDDLTFIWVKFNSSLFPKMITFKKLHHTSRGKYNNCKTINLLNSWFVDIQSTLQCIKSICMGVLLG